MVKQLLFATRIPEHVQPVGRPCGNWPKEAMNRPIWVGIVAGAKLFNFLFNSSYKLRVNSSS